MPDSPLTPSQSQAPAPKTIAGAADSMSQMSTIPPGERAKSSPEASTSTTSATNTSIESTVEALKEAVAALTQVAGKVSLNQPTSKQHIPFLVFAGLVTGGIMALIGLGDQVPTTVYALDVAALTAAGVTIIPS